LIDGGSALSFGVPTFLEIPRAVERAILNIEFRKRQVLRGINRKMGGLQGRRFCRVQGMLPLPKPTRGGKIEEFRPFLGNISDNGFVLVIGWHGRCRTWLTSATCLGQQWRDSFRRNWGGQRASCWQISV
jgi:hypothetical protein